MGALHQEISRDRRRERSRAHAPGATGPGAVGELLDAGSPARLLIDGQVYGPVAILPWPGHELHENDRAFLHLDMKGQPVYAQQLP